MKGIETCSIQLKTGVTLQLKDVLFVLGIKRNLVTISDLADQEYHVTFQEDNVLSWPKNSNIKNEITIGFRDESLYKLCNPQNLALNYEVSNSNDIWHTNLCGPMSVPSLGGFLYYVIFIDDFSRKIYIFIDDF